MDIKDIVIICEAVLLVILIIVLVAVIIRGNGQFRSYFRRTKKPEQTQLKTMISRFEKGRERYANQIAEQEKAAAAIEEQKRLDAELERSLIQQARQATAINNSRIRSRETAPSYPDRGLGNVILRTLTGGPSQKPWWE